MDLSRRILANTPFNLQRSTPKELAPVTDAPLQQKSRLDRVFHLP
jgi:hypothetical protein